MKFFNKFLLSALAVTALATTGCKKEYLDTTPSDQLSTDDLFKTTTSAYTLLNGMHALSVAREASGQTNPLDFGFPGVNMCQDIMAQDIVITSSPYDWAVYHYQYVATQGANYWMPYNYWGFFYKLINNANHLIAKVDQVQGTDQEKADIKGQAYAYRAYSYYMLVNLFAKHYNSGDLNAPGVPVYTEPTTSETAHAGRSTVGQVYDLIKSDMEQAISYLRTAGMNYSTRKDMISLNVARGLYARVALATKDYATAGLQASLARAQYGLMPISSMTTGFNANSNIEWMWSSNLSSEQYNSRSLFNFLGWMDDEGPGYANAGATRSITKSLYDQIDANDVRKEWFKADYKQKKFKLANPSTMDGNDLLMRASEMYLIEIEAKYYEDPTAAKEMLEEFVQTRYKQGTYTAPAAGPALLEEILLQRRIELWGEGQAFFDVLRLQRGLNRTTGAGNHNRTVAQVLTLPANSPQFVFKIPQREIDANEALSPSDQN